MKTIGTYQGGNIGHLILWLLFWENVSKECFFFDLTHSEPLVFFQSWIKFRMLPFNQTSFIFIVNFCPLWVKFYWVVEEIQTFSQFPFFFNLVCSSVIGKIWPDKTRLLTLLACFSIFWGPGGHLCMIVTFRLLMLPLPNDIFVIFGDWATISMPANPQFFMFLPFSG